MARLRHVLGIVLGVSVAIACLLLCAVSPTQATTRMLVNHLDTGAVRYMAPSPDNRHVVVQTTERIYSVPLNGGTVTLLAEGLAQGFTLLEQYALSPDGAQVIFRGVPAGQPAQPFGLWITPIGGGPARLLASGASTASDAMTFTFSPEGRYVLFNGNVARDLFSVPVDGSRGPIQLNSAPPASFSAPTRWEAVPGTDRVLYLSIRDWQSGETYGRANIYTVPIDGPATASVLINPDGIASIQPWAYRLTAGQHWVVFTQDDALYRSDLSGQNRIRLDPGGVVSYATVSPAGDRVAYRLRHTVSGQDRVDVYTVPLAGPASESVLVSPAPLLPDGRNDWPVFTSDGAWVTFETDLGLFVAPSVGPSSAAVKIADEVSWWPSPSGDEALFVTSLGAIEAVSTSGINPSPWPVAELPRAVTFMGDGVPPMGAQFTPNGERLVFQSRNLHIYNAPVRGPIAATHDEAGDFAFQIPDSQMRITADSSTLVYTVDGDLYAVALGSGPLLPRLQPACQSMPSSATPAPTPTGLSVVLHLPMVGRCYGTP